jgi:hypothetical protein
MAQQRRHSTPVNRPGAGRTSGTTALGSRYRCKAGNERGQSPHGSLGLKCILEQRQD